MSLLELKLTIEEQKVEAMELRDKQGPDAKFKFDYDKENSCCLCMCELYDGLEQMPLQTAIREQQVLREHIKEGQALPVVRLGKCKGMHFYHKECIENQYNAGASKEFLKCATCNIIYGKQVGDMPSGTMTWRTNRSSLPGHPDAHETIQIEYSI